MNDKEMKTALDDVSKKIGQTSKALMPAMENLMKMMHDIPKMEAVEKKTIFVANKKVSVSLLKTGAVLFDFDMESGEKYYKSIKDRK